MSYRNQDNTVRNVVIQVALPLESSQTHHLCTHVLFLSFQEDFSGLLAALNSTLICGLLPVLFISAILPIFGQMALLTE